MTLSNGPLHMNMPVLADQEVLFRHERCSLENLSGAMDDRDEGERESRKSVLAAQFDDDIFHIDYNC